MITSALANGFIPRRTPVPAVSRKGHGPAIGQENAGYFQAAAAQRRVRAYAQTVQKIEVKLLQNYLSARQCFGHLGLGHYFDH
jgi:hypothetical protein